MTQHESIVQQQISQSDRRNTERPDGAVQKQPVQMSIYCEDGVRYVVGRITDSSYTGLGFQCEEPLSPGVRLTYVHPVKNNHIAGRIVWCKESDKGGFQIGVANTADEAVDHYIFLQVCNSAEPGAIEAAYQRLARRYHPTNPTTANKELYERTLEAYDILSEPIARSTYDVSLSVSAAALNEEPNERDMGKLQKERLEIMQLLYWRRFERPYKPIVTIHEMETLLKISKERMEFNLWFLRERGWLVRSDNACFVISSGGVQAMEDLAGEKKSNP